jgi:hypothetical protein
MEDSHLTLSLEEASTILINLVSLPSWTNLRREPQPSWCLRVRKILKRSNGAKSQLTQLQPPLSLVDVMTIVVQSFLLKREFTRFNSSSLCQMVQILKSLWLWTINKCWAHMTQLKILSSIKILKDKPLLPASSTPRKWARRSMFV